jgi:hypothetical protein
MARLTKADFLARIQREASGCWLWTGPRSDGNPAGLAMLDGERLTARQVAWYYEHGHLPDVRLLPTCGLARCINPGHQRLGFCPDDAPAILEAVERGERQAVIAERFGCRRETVSRLVSRHRQEVIA